MISDLTYARINPAAIGIVSVVWMCCTILDYVFCPAGIIYRCFLVYLESLIREKSVHISVAFVV